MGYLVLDAPYQRLALTLLFKATPVHSTKVPIHHTLLFLSGRSTTSVNLGLLPRNLPHFPQPLPRFRRNEKTPLLARLELAARAHHPRQLQRVRHPRSHELPHAQLPEGRAKLDVDAEHLGGQYAQHPLALVRSCPEEEVGMVWQQLFDEELYSLVDFHESESALVEVVGVAGGL